MTDERTVLRSVACTSALGAGWGTLATVAVLLLMEPTDVIDFVGTSLIASVFGGTIGAIVGLAVGMPAVLVVYPLRSDLPHCRRVGAVLAMAGVGCVSLFVGGLELFAVFAILALPIGWSAWIGLGWIFRPDQPSS